ncbi:unnamed protein product [Caenorhabditis nigoni]
MSGPFMHMWFHTQPQDTVLFKTWNVTDAGTMAWVCAVIVVTGIVLEAMKFGRWKIEKWQKQREEVLTRSYFARLFSPIHVAQSILFMVQLCFSYVLMLIFMTFSVWLGLAVVVGLGIAKTFFQKIMMMDMMEMYFHFRIQEPILFRQWKPTDTPGYVFSCISIFIIAFCLELLKFGRQWMTRKPRPFLVTDVCCSTTEGIWEIPSEDPPRGKISVVPFTMESISDWKHFVSSCLFFAQNFVEYSLMLIAMTYNYPFLLSLLGGHALGYFLVGPLMTIKENDAAGTCCS